ncbi:SDR family oxidoreductase [Bradyrhizobium sp. ISRA443]|uniref:SDR family NAD(P)-dependent oxidoreductase n=1 Tax=unclassified Bradyrhizobium TaxID=2631580 RepID=UPI00247863BA|nr:MULTISPECIES: SDR family oxidoreductase [unclassified Bradyrhizobium]WGR93999.1 SDR family oxidoreductase [Bradyrhizobium sp. ISRA435]WGR98627.1 SDR family oxidoreductase [Bradyrhizobium sp. ISRA436]WGS05516.1 SDR family oxidoreductase [Bradyrhizobium sp. ISRA437]WGS12403.1 SDR family oxidoreductase [Bradyrhizobium sp. ISRA443]
MSNHQRFAVVTGASSGIGAAYAERMAERGYNLILVARRRNRLEEIASKIQAKTKRAVEIVTADLGDPADLLRIEALLTEREDIDVLINNAGLGALGPTSKVAAAALENLIKINVLALTRLTHAVLPGFLRRNSGTIINIASTIAVMPTPSGAGYSGTKGYVLNFTRSLQMELAKTNVTVQAVLPGPVRTEFFEASGLTEAPFPDELFMSAEELVDTALHALDQGELVCFPSLEDTSFWTAFEDARIALSRALTQSGRPATRYSERTR